MINIDREMRVVRAGRILYEVKGVPQNVAEEALALAIRHEFEQGVTRITLDPNAKNEGAIRSYERLGFRRIGILRDYQVRPGGELDDALFLDLTRSDFPEGPPLPQR